MKRLLHIICIFLGFISLGAGILGIILPVLPATPFLLLAAAMFAKGSEKFHRWFTRTVIYRKYVLPAMKDKKMPKNAKVKMLVGLAGLFLIAFLVTPVWPAKVMIAGVAVFHFYYFIARIKTAPENMEPASE